MASGGFDAATFVDSENLSEQDVASLNKTQVRAVVKHLQIEVSSAARKDALVQAVVEHLGLKEKEERSLKGSEMSTMELEKFKIEMQFKREEAAREREREKEEVERKENEKEREFQLEMKRLELQTANLQAQHSAPPVPHPIYLRRSKKCPAIAEV